MKTKAVQQGNAQHTNPKLNELTGPQRVFIGLLLISGTTFAAHSQSLTLPTRLV
jgi:hypothetical protein